MLNTPVPNTHVPNMHVPSIYVRAKGLGHLSVYIGTAGEGSNFGTYVFAKAKNT